MLSSKAKYASYKCYGRSFTTSFVKYTITWKNLHVKYLRKKMERPVNPSIYGKKTWFQVFLFFHSVHSCKKTIRRVCDKFICTLIFLLCTD